MLTFLAACALALAPQSTSGAAVAGVILDAASGRPLVGAAVRLSDLDRGALTGSGGEYFLADVPPGPQHLVVRRIGYHARTLHILVPRAGRLEFDVALEPDPVWVEGVTVSPRRPVRGLDGTDDGVFPERGLSHAALENHPLVAASDPLLALTGGEVLIEPEAPAGLHVRGGASDHTGYVLDGIPVLSPYHAAGLFSAWNPDALAGLELTGAAPSPALPQSLSGAVVARTREPGPRVRVRTLLGSAEGRLTADGPAGVAGAGFMVSLRTGFPGAIIPQDEASYLVGETGDLLAKLQLPALGGGLRLLAYDSENELGAAGAVPDVGGVDIVRNTFGWSSRSLGASWSSSGEATSIRLAAWRARAEAGSSWDVLGDSAVLSSARADHGVQATVEVRSPERGTEAGVRLQRTASSYRVASAAGTGWDTDGTTDVATVFARHTRRIATSLEAWAGGAVSLVGGRVYPAPQGQLRWRPDPRLAWTATFGRTRQFAQSLRNPESVVGHVFPADLFLGAGVSDIPVPTGDQVVLAAEWTPVPGLRLGAQGFARRMKDLVLVAPDEPGPFLTGAFSVGDGRARGVSLELTASGARYGIVASYGWQRVRLSSDDSAYVPRHGTAQTLDAGLVVFPTATASLRFGVAAAAGRRGTALSGPFEWEACNVLDQGCEFAGSPALEGPLGGTRLPAYARLDVGGRKHWHVHVAGRSVMVGVFGTLTNVLGRHNTLAYVLDPDTGEREAVEMLPRSPLVVGVDASF